jgi:hypothetical protein
MIGIEDIAEKDSKESGPCTPANWREYGFLSNFFPEGILDEWYDFPVVQNKVKGFVRNAQNNYKDVNMYEYVEKRGKKPFLSREEEQRLILQLNEKQRSCTELLSQKDISATFYLFWEKEPRSKIHQVASKWWTHRQTKRLKKVYQYDSITMKYQNKLVNRDTGPPVALTVEGRRVLLVDGVLNLDILRIMDMAPHVKILVAGRDKLGCCLSPSDYQQSVSALQTHTASDSRQSTDILVEEPNMIDVMIISTLLDEYDDDNDSDDLESLISSQSIGNKSSLWDMSTAAAVDDLIINSNSEVFNNFFDDQYSLFDGVNNNKRQKITHSEDDDNISISTMGSKSCSGLSFYCGTELSHTVSPSRIVASAPSWNNVTHIGGCTQLTSDFHREDFLLDRVVAEIKLFLVCLKLGHDATVTVEQQKNSHSSIIRVEASDNGGASFVYTLLQTLFLLKFFRRIPHCVFITHLDTTTPQQLQTLAMSRLAHAVDYVISESDNVSVLEYFRVNNDMMGPVHKLTDVFDTPVLNCDTKQKSDLAEFFTEHCLQHDCFVDVFSHEKISFLTDLMHVGLDLTTIIDGNVNVVHYNVSESVYRIHMFFENGVYSSVLTGSECDLSLTEYSADETIKLTSIRGCFVGELTNTAPVNTDKQSNIINLTCKFEQMLKNKSQKTVVVVAAAAAAAIAL